MSRRHLFASGGLTNDRRIGLCDINIDKGRLQGKGRCLIGGLPMVPPLINRAVDRRLIPQHLFQSIDDLRQLAG